MLFFVLSAFVFCLDIDCAVDVRGNCCTKKKAWKLLGNVNLLKGWMLKSLYSEIGWVSLGGLFWTIWGGSGLQTICRNAHDWLTFLQKLFHTSFFQLKLCGYRANGDKFDALALQMIEDGFLVHIMEFLGHCFMAILAATQNLLASGCKSTWASIRVMKQCAAPGFVQDCRNGCIRQIIWYGRLNQLYVFNISDHLHPHFQYCFSYPYSFYFLATYSQSFPPPPFCPSEKLFWCF